MKKYFIIYTTTIESSGYYLDIKDACFKFENAHPDLSIVGVIEVEAFHKLPIVKPDLE